MHWSTCCSRACMSTPDGRGHSWPPSAVGKVYREFALDHGTWHAFSYACTQIFCRPSNSLCDHLLNTAENWKAPIPFCAKSSDWLSHLCFLRHEPFTYESTFSRMDSLSHLCFLTHEPFHLWNYFHTYGLTLSPMLSHAWAFLPRNLLLHDWIDSLTYAFGRMSLFIYESTFSRTDWLSHLCFSRMSLVTYESTFSRVDWLSHLYFLTHEPFYIWIYFLMYGVTFSPMHSQAWAFWPMNLPSRVWIDVSTYAFLRMRLLIYESTFSRMDWLSHLSFSRTHFFNYGSSFSRMDWLSQLYFLTNAPFHLWIYLLTYKLILSPMIFHAWAFSPMNLLSHVWIESLTYAFSRMSLVTYEFNFSSMDWLFDLSIFTHEPFHLWICLLTYGLTLLPMLSQIWAFSPMNLPSHVWIASLTYAFSHMSLFTYESTFPHVDWPSHLCFLTHEPFHLWIHFLSYGLTLSPLLSHAWALSPMNLPSHEWIDSLTYVFGNISHFTCESSLFTYETTFSRMDWISYLCFLTHEPFHIWIYLLTDRLTLLPMLSHAWAFSSMNLPSHVWIDFLTYAFRHMSLSTYESTFSRIAWLNHLCFLMHVPFYLWLYLLTNGLTVSFVFLTHDPFHLRIYCLTYGLTLSPMLSHAWNISLVDVPSHVWINSLTYALSRMSLLTFE